MKVLLQHTQERLRKSLWFIPACMSLAAVGLAIYAGHLDERFATGPYETLGPSAKNPAVQPR